MAQNMKKQIYIICLTIFCGLLIVGCSSDNLGEQDNKNETEQAQFNKDIREFYEPIVLVENEDLKISAISVQYLNDYGVIELFLENKSNKLVSISLDKLFFSGIEIEALISCDIPPKSSSNEYIYIESINSLEDFNDKIEGTFNTLNTIKDKYDFMFKG